MSSLIDLTRNLDGPWGPVVSSGTAVALEPELDAGTILVVDRLVGSEGRPVGEPFRSAPLLAGALRRQGLPVRLGALLRHQGSAGGSARPERPFDSGGVAVDLERALPPDARGDRPVAVLRAIVDHPEVDLHFLPSMDALEPLRRAMDAAVAPALAAWARAVGTRTVLLAGPRSFCAGVERAIETVERALARHGAPVYVRRQIVHNRHVVDDLESRGAVFVHELDEVPDGAMVVFSAHGVAPAVRREAVRRDLQVIDATCPLVAKVHRDLHRFRTKGYQVVLIGHAGHDETEGTLGEDEDVVLLENADDVAALEVLDPDKLAYVTQTTLSPEDVGAVTAALAERFPRVEGPHAADICYATQNRQEAVRAIASSCDLVLVVGSANSSNTARLVEVARREGARAEMVDDETDIELGWLAGATTVGVTAGASAPPALVARAVTALSGLGPLDVQERPVRTENVTFPLPLEVR